MSATGVGDDRMHDGHALADDEIHLWRLDLSRENGDAALNSLSLDEQQRAVRFAFERDRRRFLAARDALRRVLSLYTGIDAGDLRFAVGPHGKPALDGYFGSSVRFNLSHSDDAGLIAVALREEVGVDLEVRRELPDVLELAGRHFTPEEAHALRSLTPLERSTAFLTCWTRKEACVKASGLGLTIDTRSFDAGTDRAVRSVRLHEAKGGRLLQVITFIDDDTIASVASTGTVRRTRRFALS